jgi:hypothetical protein
VHNLSIQKENHYIIFPQVGEAKAYGGHLYPPGDFFLLEEVSRQNNFFQIRSAPE